MSDSRATNGICMRPNVKFEYYIYSGLTYSELRALYQWLRNESKTDVLESQEFRLFCP